MSCKVLSLFLSTLWPGIKPCKQKSEHYNVTTETNFNVAPPHHAMCSAHAVQGALHDADHEPCTQHSAHHVLGTCIT